MYLTTVIGNKSHTACYKVEFKYYFELFLKIIYVQEE